MLILSAELIPLRRLELILSLHKIMKIKYLFLFTIIFSAILLGGILAEAKEDRLADIQFPVSELGRCANPEACRVYCDQPEHRGACLDFAEKNNLMSQEELRTARKFLAAGGRGPGGCTGKETCDAYCNDMAHIEECVSFAERYDLIPPEEIEEAKKIRNAISRGVKPPNCRNKKECDIYCSQADHMEECIIFAQAAGFMGPEELEETQKVLRAIKKGAKPPPCRGKEECDIYCADEAHFEECLGFAEAAGFITSEEAEMARRTGGKGPGGCREKEECDAFCQKEENIMTCVDFAERYGLMSREEAEKARRFGGKGPGGCRGEAECEAFCQRPENQEVCFEFAKEHGLIPEEDLRQIEEGRRRIQEAINQAPPAVLECLNSSLGPGKVERLKYGTMMPSEEIGNQVRECFEKFMGPPEGPADHEPGPEAGD